MPSGVASLKLLHAGKLLNNGETLAEARVQTDFLVTIHLVVALPKARTTARGAPWRSSVAHDAHSVTSAYSRRSRPRPSPRVGAALCNSPGCFLPCVAACLALNGACQTDPSPTDWSTGRPGGRKEDSKQVCIHRG